MLRITPLREGMVETLVLEGRLAGPWVQELRAAANAALERSARLELHLAGVRFATPEGARLLEELLSRGASIPVSSHIVEALLERQAMPTQTGSHHGSQEPVAGPARGGDPEAGADATSTAAGYTAGDGQEALLAALRAGCPEASEALVRAHAGAMRAVAQRILGSETEADDAVQEAFLSAFRALERFEGRSSLATWLHRITANAALMRLRARRGQVLASIDDLLPEFTSHGAWPEAVHAWAEPEENPLLREELCGQVRECIARLPEKHRIPLLMRDIEGLGNGEIARRLDISVNAAKIRVHRARQAVRTLLEPLMAEQAP